MSAPRGGNSAAPLRYRGRWRRHIAPTIRALAIVGLTAAALTLSACGDDGDTSAAPAATTATTPTQTAVSRAPSKLDISKNRTAKPTIPKPSGAPPTKLVIQDVVKGRGATAKVDDMVSVHYVGISYSNGEEFDASWNGGQPVGFQLSRGQLIDGWVDGIPGMKVGGRRLLIIPPDLAYGPNGRPPSIGPNETLVFVIDLLNTTPASS